MSKAQTYIVTDHAGPKVAGRRVAAGEKITLTETEAAGELRAGTIVAAETVGEDAGTPLPDWKKPGNTPAKETEQKPQGEASAETASKPAQTGDEKSKTGRGSRRKES